VKAFISTNIRANTSPYWLYLHRQPTPVTGPSTGSSHQEAGPPTDNYHRHHLTMLNKTDPTWPSDRLLDMQNGIPRFWKDETKVSIRVPRMFKSHVRPTIKVNSYNVTITIIT
jgi:hypothetical protein